MSDAYEQWLKAQIENVVRNYPGEHSIVQDVLIDALRKYQELQVKPIEAPAFSVGDRVRHVMDTATAEIIALGYKVKWDGQDEPSYYCYTSEQLTHIVESEEQS